MSRICFITDCATCATDSCSDVSRHRDGEVLYLTNQFVGVGVTALGFVEGFAEEVDEFAVTGGGQDFIAVPRDGGLYPEGIGYSHQPIHAAD
jgi:hypothetical protein